MSDLGDRLRARRKQLKLSLRALAAKCGLSVSFLCELESGKRGVGADSLLALSQALGLPMDQLMRGGERQTAGIDVQLPTSLMRFAQDADLPFRHAACLFWMMRTVMDHRPAARRVGLESVDWHAFHGAVRDFL